MTYKLRLIGIVAVIIVTLVSASFILVGADATRFPCGASLATATTTVTYQSAGNSTTTIVYDAYCLGGTNQSYTGDNNPADSAVLLLDRTASSTLSQTRVEYEYSMDGIDWYKDRLSYDALNSTTTSPFFTGGVTLTWQFASTTFGGQSGALTRDSISIPVETPTRYVRAIITVPVGALNSSIWGRVVPKKEVNR